MGGFVLYDEEKVVGALDPNKLSSLLREGKLIMPSINEEEIRDRSKGDGLSKTLVVVQTTWFIGQCIARRVQGLVVTELELVTLAFATLNFIIYFFWWNKPLDVVTSVRVDLLPASPLRSPKLPPPEEGEPHAYFEFMPLNIRCFSQFTTLETTSISKNVET
jgi:hypothetical protein